MTHILRHILLAVCALAIAMGAAAQNVTAAKCFAEAPQSLIPLLPAPTRLDMLDYYRAGSAKASANTLGGQARVVSETEECVSFELSDSITAQIFVLNPQSNCPIIGYIETFRLPARDSRMRFFTCRWKPLDLHAEPSLRQWLTRPTAARIKAAQAQLPFLLAEYAYDSPSRTLTATLTLPSYFTPSDAPEALQWLRRSIKMKWTGKKFKII